MIDDKKSDDSDRERDDSVPTDAGMGDSIVQQPESTESGYAERLTRFGDLDIRFSHLIPNGCAVVVSNTDFTDFERYLAEHPDRAAVAFNITNPHSDQFAYFIIDEHGNLVRNPDPATTPRDRPDHRKLRRYARYT